MQPPQWEFKRLTKLAACAGVTNKLYPRKRHFLVKEKYVEDARQEEKDVPDLLEAIMRPTCPVKEELQKILFKMSQFRPKITKIRVKPKS